MNIARAIAVLVLAAFASACTPAVMVPPTTSVTTESYATPPQQHASAEGSVQFGPVASEDEAPASPMMAEPKKHDGGLSAGAIVGIVGGVLGVGLTALLVYGLVSLGNSIGNGMKSFGNSMSGFGGGEM